MGMQTLMVLKFVFGDKPHIKKFGKNRLSFPKAILYEFIDMMERVVSNTGPRENPDRESLSVKFKTKKGVHYHLYIYL